MTYVDIHRWRRFFETLEDIVCTGTFLMFRHPPPRLTRLDVTRDITCDIHLVKSLSQMADTLKELRLAVFQECVYGDG